MYFLRFWILQVASPGKGACGHATVGRGKGNARVALRRWNAAGQLLHHHRLVPGSSNGLSRGLLLFAKVAHMGVSWRRCRWPIVYEPSKLPSFCIFFHSFGNTISAEELARSCLKEGYTCIPPLRIQCGWFFHIFPIKSAKVLCDVEGLFGAFVLHADCGRGAEW